MAGVEVQVFLLTFNVVFITLWDYRASVQPFGITKMERVNI